MEYTVVVERCFCDLPLFRMRKWETKTFLRNRMEIIHVVWRFFFLLRGNSFSSFSYRDDRWMWNFKGQVIDYNCSWLQKKKIHLLKVNDFAFSLNPPLTNLIYTECRYLWNSSCIHSFIIAKLFSDLFFNFYIYAIHTNHPLPLCVRPVTRRDESDNLLDFFL